MTSEERDRETLPPGAPCPMATSADLDPGVRIIGALIDHKVGAFLEALEKRDKERDARDARQSEMLENAINHAMVSQELLRQATEASRRAEERSNDAIKLAREADERSRENSARIDRMQERMTYPEVRRDG